MHKRSYISHAMRLSWALALNRFKLRIAGRYLGIFWYVLEPLAFFIILLSLQVNLGAASIPEYPTYLLLGLVMTNFFIATTSAAVASIRDNRNLVQSISIPQEVLPLSVVIQFCFSHAIEIAFFIVASAIYGLLSWAVLWYIPIFVVYLVFISGLSLLLAALGVFVEDLNNIWSVGSRLLWLGTPIFYIVKPGTILYAVNQFNPLYRFMEIGRDAIVYGSMPSAPSIAIAVALSAAMFAIGAAVFAATKRRFGEFI